MRWILTLVAVAAISALAAHAAADDRAICTAIEGVSAQARLKACNAMLAKHDKDDAVAAELRAHRGRAHSDLEDNSKAVLDLDAAITLDPKAGYFYWRGLAYQRSSNIKSAVADYDQAIKREPTMPAARINRAILKGQMGDFAGGVADTSQVLRTRPDHVMALVNRAILQASRGRFVQAEQDLEKIEQVAPGFPSVVLVRGLMNLQRHEYEPAIAAFTPTIDTGTKEKRLSGPLLGRAFAYIGLKKFDKARADIAAAENLWGAPGTCGDCFGTMAELEVRQGKFAAAETYAAKALALQPDSRQIQVAQCYVRAAGPRPAAAIGLCTEAAKRYPQSIFPVMNRAMAHLKLGDLDAALKDYDTILKLGDWTGSGHFGRSVIFKRRGDGAKAKAEIALAKKASPNVEERFATVGIRP
jgi:tetratricopeptide (TPR) repeat protein